MPSGNGGDNFAVADGYLLALNAYDNQIYCMGKGPSETTVSVQTDVVSWGDSVLFKGTVMDIAAGTQQQEQAARFPNGVPAVADVYQEDWMQYVYMQQPCPSYVEGVQVKLETLDPNYNFYEIGTVTTDASGMYKLLWEPPVPGEYTIIATFAGTNSYYRSYAETAIGVTEAPAPSASIEPEQPAAHTQQTPTEPAPTEPTAATETSVISAEVAIIAAVAVIAVIGVAAYWMLKRK